MEETKPFSGFEPQRKIQVIETDSIKKVFVKGQPYMSWRIEDQVAPRIAISQLYESGLATQEELAEAFGVHIKSVYNYIMTFTSGGMQNLIGQRTGPRESWKLTPQTKAKILFLALKEGITEYAEIQKRLELWNTKLSIESIRQVLIENGFVKEEINMPKIEQERFFNRGDNNRQLEMQLSDCNENIVSVQQNKKIEDSLSLNLERRDRSSYSQSQRIYLDQLEQGVYNTYAGGLLFVPLLRQYNFLSTIKNVINIETYEGYSLDELCLTLFYFDLFRFESMENFKTVYPEEFGMLIGRLSSPSLYTLRRFLHRVKELYKSEEMTDEFGKEYLRRGIAKWGVLYIDGHFMPYYGIYCISMGWCRQHL